MAKFPKLLLLMLFICSRYAHAYSNLIVLGDSLSDTGNFKEASYLYETTYDDIAQHSYIPTTNPVDFEGKKTLTIGHIRVSNPLWDTEKYLEAQPALASKQRRLRSINWSQYLTHELLGSQHHMLPSTSTKLTANKKLSVNYAWWAAVTSEGCFDDNYHRLKKHCRLNILRKKRALSNVDSRLIPGVITQAKLVQEDIQHRRIYHDNNTLYILFAGGNGLYTPVLS